MEALQILRLRLALLEGRLGGVERAIARVIAGEDGRKYKWSRDEFSNKIKELRSALASETAGRIADNAAWTGWANQQSACEPLFREALTWLHAAGQPAFEPTGPAALARGLVDELQLACGLGVTPVIAPDVDDSFSDFVQIIRLRFPPGDIWDIPIVAHEFGHFAVLSRNGLGRQQELKDYIKNKLAAVPPFEQPRLSSWLNEFFADIFATYTLGPAFVMSSLLLRFDIAFAYNDSDPEHPSFAARALAILETMEGLYAEDDALGTVNGWLAAQWKKLLESAASPKALEEVKGIAADLFGIVCRIAPNARYAGWPGQARQLYEVLVADQPAPAKPLPRDLLNAAWMALTLGSDPARVSARVLDVWRPYSDG